jgi:Domain of unknown function (DUF4136)
MNLTLKSTGTALLCLALLGGCASLRSVTSDVSSFGEWPAERKAGSFAFERLPSQAARAADTAALEAAALPALQKAGFTPVAAGADPDVLVQLGARSQRSDFGAWNDPLWWRGGFGYWRHGPWLSPRWSLTMRSDFERFDREVAVLLRDRASGKPLFEARAVNEGNLDTANATTLSAMFEAALMDFPKLGINPRRVTVSPAP